jgi:hypothetical protein
VKTTEVTLQMTTVKDSRYYDLEKSQRVKSSKKLSKEEKINERFDDIVSRIDASQRSEASMRQILSIVLNDLKDLKHQLRYLK